MAIKRDQKGRFSGTGGGGSSRSTEQMANTRRSARAQDVFSARGANRSSRSAGKQVKAKETAAKAANVYARRSIGLKATGGAKLGGTARKLRTKSPVMDTVRQQTPNGAAKAVAKRGGNALQQRAAANSAATRDMRRSSFGRATARSMMRAAFG